LPDRVPGLTIDRRAAGVAGRLVVSWAVLTGLLILTGEGIEHSSFLESIDQHITNFVVGHRTPALNHVMTAVTWTGSWATTLAVAVLVAFLAWRRRLPALAVVAILAAWWGELLAVILTKAVVRRPRPPEAVRLVVAHGWAFPSGHTANAVVVFSAAAAILVTAFVSRTEGRVLTWVLAGLATALVGFSRIELGVHWTTDVVASLVWTPLWILIVIRVLSGSRQLRPAAGREGDG
jgi:undecaprenyl-diphosphatase